MLHQTEAENKTVDRREEIQMADALRGKDPIAGLKLPDVRRAITRAERSTTTTETHPDRGPRRYKLGPVVAEVCVGLLLWIGKEQGERGIHKSYSELEHETGFTKRQLQTARNLCEEEGLLEVTAGKRPNATRQNTLYWRLDLWRLHEVVFASALSETRTALENEGRKKERDRLNGRRRKLETALNDLHLSFTEDPMEAGGAMTTWGDGDDNLGGLQEVTQESTFVDKSTPVDKGAEKSNKSSKQDHTYIEEPSGKNSFQIANESSPVEEAGQLFNEIYNHMKEQGYRLDNEEYKFNLARMRSVLEQDNPTSQEIQELPKACAEYFTWRGTLDVAKALRRHRQQEARGLEQPQPKTRHAFRSGRVGKLRIDNE